MSMIIFTMDFKCFSHPVLIHFPDPAGKPFAMTTIKDGICGIDGVSRMEVLSPIMYRGSLPSLLAIH